MYAFDAAALRSALSRLRSDNAQQELYLTDAIAIVRGDGQIVRAHHVDDSAQVSGVNDRVQLSEVAAELNRRIIAGHQRAGVTIIDPATTWIDVDVTKMELNTSLHVSDMPVLEGVEYLLDADRTICVVSIPRVIEAAPPGEAPVTEVIGAVKEEGAEGEAGAGEKKGGKES